ncbi:sushi domain-containing protein 2-like isoform X2 [Dendronephthya gigantea]|uniref:sushi domain-containing protein 2-like isoform X2 n=1 Tax=Dendronephthya gigantea TaxID=151771 RepID=UPI001068DBC3|nr:sushi domain-containing protein 2-like isoform X2 [Dendronephthya gigantea]
MRVELEDFYPYGPDNGDLQAPINDDGSTGRINIGFSFPFFDDDHDSLFVNTNGVISFLREVSQYTPDPFPLSNNRRLVAPFWADVDTRKGGVVYYRETQDFSIRTRISEEIRNFFVRQRGFLAKWALIVTWLNVARFGGPSSPNNTFQTILATDGVSSFSIFLYNKITWTFGSASDNTAAQAGFNAGDGIRYFNIPNSRTPAIINIASTSNCQVPGKWIFKIDGDEVVDNGCTSDGDLELSPRSGIELGGTKVFIGGPCYNPGDEIVCRFNKTINTTGVIVSSKLAYCITPPLYKMYGRMPMDVSLDGGITFNHTGIFRSIPLARNPPDIKGLEVENWANSTKTILTWNPSAVNSTYVDIEISAFDAFKFLLHDVSLASFKEVLNSGSYHLDFSAHVFSTRRRRRSVNTASPIAIVKITPSAPRVKRFGVTPKNAIFSSVFLITWQIFNDIECWHWSEFENSTEIAKLQEELIPCPTSFRQMLADSGQFIRDSGIKRMLSAYIYHRGSSTCFRSRNPSPSGAGQQCCYNSAGSLVVGSPGGGSFDKKSPDEDFWGHMGLDVLPWFACCGFSENCKKYFEKRPSDDGKRYVPPPIADTRGDPHLSTFDGTFYTFNGYGEYILLHVNNGTDFEFQGRMNPITDNQGSTTKATALTALVAKAAESDTVQIEYNKRRKIDVLVNGDRAEFDEESRLDYTGVFVVKQNQSKIGVYFASGESLHITVVEEFLTYQISIPVRYKGKTAGLLGFWDDSKDQEFLLPNGIFIPTNSTSQTIHNEFGQKWIATQENTLFTYHSGKSYSSFVNLGFTPVFLDDTSSLFSNSTFEAEARNLCGGNKECIFDVAVTGKTSVGEATLEYFNELMQRTNNSRIVAIPIFFGCDGVENSMKQTDSCGVCDGDNSTCTDCDGNIRPGFVNNGTCAGFHDGWSEWSACFKSGDGKIRTRNQTCSVKGRCGHLAENIQRQTCNDENDGFYDGWSEWSACFKNGDGKIRTRNQTCSVKGRCGHLAENIQRENCDEEDDAESRSSVFYFLAIGVPMLVLFLMVSAVGLFYWSFKKRQETAGKPGGEIDANTYMMS